MNEGRIIRKHLRALEAKAELVDFIREQCKTEGGRLNESGLAFISMAHAGGWKQASVAVILEITPGAVSQHYKRQDRSKNENTR